MATKKETGDTPAAAASDEARTVSYVVNRPYSAGEAPEVVAAQVVREHAGDKDVLDLLVGGVTLEGVRRSARCEPGTWFEG